MIFDMQNSVFSDQIITLPDWAFGAPARPDIKEQEVLRGSDSNRVYIQGTADQTPSSNPGGSW